MIQRSGLLTLIIVIGTGFVLGGCSSQENAPQNGENLVKTVNVHTKTVEPREFTSYVRMIGTVESSQDVRLSAEVSGRIINYRVQEGERVEKGDVIAQINDEQLRQEEARLEALTRQSKERYQRQERLWKQDSIGSEIEYLNAKYQYQQNKAALEQVRVNIRDAKVKAPFDAVMNQKMVEEGEMVTAGTPLARLIAQNRMKVTAGVPARYSDLVMPGDSMKVWFDTMESDTLAGPIHYVSNSIDPQARTFSIEMMIPDPNRQYKVGMMANVRLKVRDLKKKLVIGSEYVYRKEGNYVVYTAENNDDGNKVARERVVELGPTYNNQVVISKGLSPGQKLITVGSSFLDNEMRIEVVEDEQNTFADHNR